MTIMRNRNKHLGFTLVELAIVLAVMGVISAGLFRLISGGNQQVKDTSVASQQIQLINAVKGFLGSGSGQAWMGTACGPATCGGQNYTLTLPTAANKPDGQSNLLCKAGYAANTNLQAFCDSLPAGFSQATINAYGQSYNVYVQTGPVAATAPAGTPPTTYSFVIVTSGGDTIPDADGGKISSQIGNDGGFIYAAAGACGAQACGTFGGWSANLTNAATATPPGYSVPPGNVAAGHVVSRTFFSPEYFSSLPWLARQFMTGNDTPATATTSPNYNTMATDLFLGGKNLFMSNNNNATAPFIGPIGALTLQGASLYMGGSGATTGGGSINLDAGTLFLEGGAVKDLTSPGSAIQISANAPYLNSTTSNPLETLTTSCSTVTTSLYGSGNASCQAALQINGDENIVGQLNANTLFAGTFIYQTSDARLKTNIQPIEHGLDNVMRIKPVSFTFKATGEKSLGVIAQDIETIYPQLVANKPDGMKSVNYDGLIAPLVSAVQELKHENAALQQQLKDQSARLEVLERELDAKQ